jgi:6-pyruvoyltetrahydropterin/6-carboxytetrahydropterin synthase
MFTVSKEFNFSASHQLAGLAPGHQCGRLHGHNYTVRVTLKARRLNLAGFVKDYGELDFVRKVLDSQFEHQHLNSMFPAMQPSAENLARFLYETVARHLRATDERFLAHPDVPPFYETPGHRDGYYLHSVDVKETDKTEARWCPYE